MNNRPPKKNTVGHTTMSILSYLADSGSTAATIATGYLGYGLKEGVRAIAHQATDTGAILMDVTNHMVKDTTMKMVDAVGLTAIGRETIKFYTNLYQVSDSLTGGQITLMIMYSLAAETGSAYGLYNMTYDNGEDNEKHMIANTAAFASSAEALTFGRYLTTMWANNNIKNGTVPAKGPQALDLDDLEEQAAEISRPRFSNLG